MTREPRIDRPVVLIGARGAGKTSVGRALAPLLGVPFVDLDDEVLQWARYSGDPPAATPGELLATVGSWRFRALETQVLRRLLEPSPRLVLAAGGGCVEHPDARTWLRRTATCVWLRAPVDVLQERLRRDPTPRPALDGVDPVEEVPRVLARREPLYRDLAARTVEAGEGTPQEVAARVAEALAEPAPAR